MPNLRDLNFAKQCLNEKILKIFNQNKITTTVDFLREDIEKLTTLSKLSLPDVVAIRTEILNKYSAPLLNAKELYIGEKTKKSFLDTGIQSLSDIVGSGLPLGYITEICGLADSGKTQLCLQLSINCVKSFQNNVLYIDTKGDFSSIRIQKILDYCGYDIEEKASILSRIKVIRVWNIVELIEILEQMKQKVFNIHHLSLIVIDSMPSLIFQHLGDRSKVGLSFLNKFVNAARFLCKNLMLSVVCVNILTRWVEQDLTETEGVNYESVTASEPIWKETYSRCMGRYWQHIPALVLRLEKCEQNHSSKECNIKVTITKSINEKCFKTCNLQISDDGVT